ncbi:MAG: 2-hydroxyacyl-CoA dehydratase, partial [bacterium]|nr:2-hydroxyacyl-CoA dehydratase [bacterium]
MNKKKVIGVTCAYTPLALIDAAGFSPYRILPMGDNPDEAGQVLHDNLCPHIKKILDRGLAGDIPDIHGMVFMNSCDAMRRLADAWRKVDSQNRITLVDLPMTTDERSVDFFTGELIRLQETLAEWGGEPVSEDSLIASMIRYNELFDLISQLRERAYSNKLASGMESMQAIYNTVMTSPLEESLSFLKEKIAEQETAADITDEVPIFIFGNVMPDPEVFSLFKSCGARIVSEELCTGSRIFNPVDLSIEGSAFTKLAHSILTKPACARTFSAAQPGKLSTDILKSAQESGAKGVIAHTVKFCDPYLGRIPDVRNTFRDEGIPFLLLEGDCTLRSM